ncbi:hypothetical protein [Bartonella queenslandensis]|uniref:hypothetical protein n=1 Tax=Bartonella queenslandensis TaxID=481138 RepID=UPI0002E15D6C|nr:hypothetical protein [Bartonella queenslandensis]
MPLMNHIKTKAVLTLETSKIYDNVAVLFHKRKDDDIQWLLRYNIHEWRYEMRSSASRNIPLTLTYSVASTITLPYQ